MGHWRKSTTEGLSGEAVDDLLQVPSLQRLAHNRVTELEVCHPLSPTASSLRVPWVFILFIVVFVTFSQRVSEVFILVPGWPHGQLFWFVETSDESALYRSNLLMLELYLIQIGYPKPSPKPVILSVAQDFLQ